MSSAAVIGRQLRQQQSSRAAGPSVPPTHYKGRVTPATPSTARFSLTQSSITQSYIGPSIVGSGLGSGAAGGNRIAPLYWDTRTYDLSSLGTQSTNQGADADKKFAQFSAQFNPREFYPHPAHRETPNGGPNAGDGGRNARKSRKKKEPRRRFTWHCFVISAKALLPGVVMLIAGAIMSIVGFLGEPLDSTSDSTSTAQQSSTSQQNDLSSSHAPQPPPHLPFEEDSAAAETGTNVSPMKTHLHNLTYVGPVIMGLGGIVIIAACILTFEVRDTLGTKQPPDASPQKDSIKKSATSIQPSSSSIKKKNGDLPIASTSVDIASQQRPQPQQPQQQSSSNHIKTNQNDDADERSSKKRRSEKSKIERLKKAKSHNNDPCEDDISCIQAVENINDRHHRHRKRSEKADADRRHHSNRRNNGHHKRNNDHHTNSNHYDSAKLRNNIPTTTAINKANADTSISAPQAPPLDYNYKYVNPTVMNVATHITCDDPYVSSDFIGGHRKSDDRFIEPNYRKSNRKPKTDLYAIDLSFVRIPSPQETELSDPEGCSSVHTTLSEWQRQWTTRCSCSGSPTKSMLQLAMKYGFGHGGAAGVGGDADDRTSIGDSTFFRRSSGILLSPTEALSAYNAGISSPYSTAPHNPSLPSLLHSNSHSHLPFSSSSSTSHFFTQPMLPQRKSKILASVESDGLSSSSSASCSAAADWELDCARLQTQQQQQPQQQLLPPPPSLPVQTTTTTAITTATTTSTPQPQHDHYDHNQNGPNRNSCSELSLNAFRSQISMLSSASTSSSSSASSSSATPSSYSYSSLSVSNSAPKSANADVKVVHNSSRTTRLEEAENQNHPNPSNSSDPLDTYGIGCGR